MNDLQIIHPFVQVHYTDALKLSKLVYLVETFSPNFAETWDNVRTGDTASWEEYKKLVLEIVEDGRTIEDQLNWSEKNGY